MTKTKSDPLYPGGVTYAAKQPVTSLYIHVPFCKSKCFYCDFYSVPQAGSGLIQSWHRSLIRELERLAEEAEVQGLHLAPLETLYFGGGTPSLLPPDMLISLIDRTEKLFSLATSCDITIEANPESYSTAQKAGALEILAEAGVNRISFGLQSSSDKLLRRIGRRHTVMDVIFALEAAAGAGISQLAVDLMTGLPGQTLEDIDETLELLAGLPVSHVSSFALTLAQGTPLAALFEASPGLFPDDGLEREMTHRVIHRLNSLGFEHYEISNFAKAGARSRHNLTYWKADPYMAAGPAAASYMAGIRRQNPASLGDWTALMDHDAAGPFSRSTIEEVVDEKAARIETMILGLRILEGVTRSRFRERHGLDYDQVFGEQLRLLEEAGLLALEKSAVRLTEKGLDFADRVARELL